MRLMRLVLPLQAFIALIVALLPHASVIAQVPPISIPAESFGPICAATGLCNNSPTVGFGSLALFIINIVIPSIRSIFIGVGVGYVAWYAIQMILSGYEESTLTEQKKAFGHAAIGMAIAGASSLIVATFAPSATGANLVNPVPFAAGVERIVDFIAIVTGTFLVFIISTAGFRIIALQGNESEVDKQKKSFFNGLLGIVILFTARTVVQALIPGGSGPSLIVMEVGGIIRFLLEIIAALAVASFMVSGFLFIIAVHNDSLKQRARRILLSTVIILIIVIFSHTLVSLFIPVSAPPSELSGALSSYV